jgi:hypothetical protein
MKKVVYASLIVVLLYACKKQEDVIKEPETPKNAEHLTATVNGASFTADTHGCLSSVLPSGIRFYYQGTGNLIAGTPAINLSGSIKKGTFQFGKGIYVNTASYTIDKVKYSAIRGSMTVTEIDSTEKAISYLKATFEFETDTIKGVSFKVTNGDVLLN